METSNFIFLVVLVPCLLVLLYGIGQLFVLTFESRILAFQKYYVRKYERNVWVFYKSSLNFIKKSGTIPILYVSEFSFMETNPKMVDMFKKFREENKVFFLIFPKEEDPHLGPVPELCLYFFDSTGNDKIAISPFFQLLCKDLAFKSGYTEEDIKSIMWKGIESSEKRRSEIVEKLKSLK